MALNQFAKKYFSFPNRNVRSRKCRRMENQLTMERLEDRKMMAQLFWANRAEFDTEFGDNTAAARQVIDQALLDWRAAIESFNYRNVGQDGRAPHPYYVLNPGVRDLQTDPNSVTTLASAKPVGIDEMASRFPDT